MIGRPRLAVDHIIQKTILRVIVIITIAAKALLFEQHIVERGDRMKHIRIGTASLIDRDGQCIDAPKVIFNVEIGIVAEGDGQCGAAQVDGFFRPRNRLTKFSVKIGNQFGEAALRQCPLQGCRGERFSAPTQ